MAPQATNARTGRAAPVGTATVERPPMAPPMAPLVALDRQTPLRRRVVPAGPRPGYGQDYLRTEFCASLRALGAL